MKKILEYLHQTYAPNAMILYGSYADGTNNDNSDFDALVISDVPLPSHDTSSVDHVRLDVFIYPTSYFEEIPDCEEFVQIFGGKILLDTNGIAANLLRQISDYVSAYVPKSHTENAASVAWCEKMLLRTQREDTEGYFRWHWLLTESLEIYCDLCGIRYLGPKKSIAQMKQSDPQGAALYCQALSAFTQESLGLWINYLRHLLENCRP